MMIPRETVHQYEKLCGQLASSHAEIAALAKKSPNDAVNKFKLGLINSTIQQFNSLLPDYRPFADFSEFSDDELPSNSDVSFVLAQYLECAEKFRADHVVQIPYRGWYWNVDDFDPDADDDDSRGIQTRAPKKLTRKD